MKILLLLAFATAAQQAYERANALFVKQQFQAALDAVEEALRLDANLVPALTLRAKLAMAARRNDLARADLERAVQIDSKAAYAQFLLGLILYQQNELQLAVKPLEAASALNPKDARAPLYLGLTRESLGDTEQAAALYQRSLRLDETVESLLIAARLEILLDHPDRAAQLIERALKRAPASRDAHFESARLAAHRKHCDEAVKQGERALRLESGETTDLQIHALLARCYQALGDSEAAARHARLVR